MPTPRRAVGRWSTDDPSNSTLPALCSWNPAMMRSSVVLPQPLGPSSATSSPAATSSEISLAAVVEPKRCVMPRSESVWPRRAEAGRTGAGVGLVMLTAMVRAPLLPGASTVACASTAGDGQRASSCRRSRRDPASEHRALVFGHAGEIADGHGPGRRPPARRSSARWRRSAQACRAACSLARPRIPPAWDAPHGKPAQRNATMDCTSREARRGRRSFRRHRSDSHRERQRRERRAHGNRPHRPAAMTQVEEVADVRGQQQDREQHQPAVRAGRYVIG